MNEIQQGTIALYYLILGAFGYNFKDLIKWASGTFNPVYFDNRILLSDRTSRRTVKKYLAFLVKNGQAFDYIYGIPKAGIGPATLLAMELKKPLLIKHGGKYYAIDVQNIERVIRVNGGEKWGSLGDVIAATIPFGIVFGIIGAEIANLPFLFVREKEKDHGKKKQIEGIVISRQQALLIDPFVPNVMRYTEDATDALMASGITVREVIDIDISQHITFMESLSGKRIAAVEDLISTGESSLKEVLTLREAGAIVPKIYSIFNYALPAATENFKKNDCESASILSFPQFLVTYKQTGQLPEEDAIELLNWYDNQPTWAIEKGLAVVKDFC